MRKSLILGIFAFVIAVGVAFTAYTQFAQAYEYYTLSGFTGTAITNATWTGNDNANENMRYWINFTGSNVRTDENGYFSGSVSQIFLDSSFNKPENTSLSFDSNSCPSRAKLDTGTGKVSGYAEFTRNGGCVNLSGVKFTRSVTFTGGGGTYSGKFSGTSGEPADRQIGPINFSPSGYGVSASGAKYTPPAVATPPVVTASASNVTKTSATLEGVITSNGTEVGGKTASIQNHSFRYGTGGGYSNSVSVDSSFTTSLNNLVQGTKYNVAASAVNSAGLQGTANFSFTTPSEVYSLTVTRSGNGSGNIRSNERGLSELSFYVAGGSQTERFSAGTLVTLKASAPLSGQTFNWSGDCAAAGAPLACMVNIDKDKNVYANYSVQEAATGPTVQTNNATDITQTTATLNGTVTNNGREIGGARASMISYDFYLYNTQFSPLSQVPGSAGANNRFTRSVTGLAPNTTYYVKACATNSADISTTINPTNPSCGSYVSFKTSQVQSVYSLTVKRSGNGGGNVSSNDKGLSELSFYVASGDQTEKFTAGTIVTLIASNPLSGQTFSWSEDCLDSGSATTCAVTMNGDKNVTATYNITPIDRPISQPPQKYSLTLNRIGNEGGNVTGRVNGVVTTYIAGVPSDTQTTSYDSGTSVILNASPVAGAKVNWIGCVSGNNICTAVINASKTITAEFVKIPTTPTAFFTATPISTAVRLPVIFDGAGSTGGGSTSINSYEWNFSDTPFIESTSGSTHSRSYTIPGTYTVSLRVRNTNGTWSPLSAPQTIMVYASSAYTPAAPTVSFTVPPNATIGQDITFNANDSQNGQTYRWEFGDGVIESGTNPITTHAYVADGLFLAKLTVSNSDGSASESKRITVSPDKQTPLVINRWHNNPLAIREKLFMQVDNYPVNWFVNDAKFAETDGGVPVTYIAPNTPQNIKVTATSKSSLGGTSPEQIINVVEPYYFSCMTVSSTAIQVNWTRRFSDPIAYEPHTLQLNGSGVRVNEGFVTRSELLSGKSYTFTLNVDYTAEGMPSHALPPISCTTYGAESKTPSDLKAFAAFVKNQAGAYQSAIYLNWKDNSTLAAASSFEIQRIALNLKPSTISATPTGPNSARLEWRNNTASTPYYGVFTRNGDGALLGNLGINAQYDPSSGGTGSTLYASDSSLSEGTQYSYQVKACSAISNIGGIYVKSSESSSYSLNDKASVTPPCGENSASATITTPPNPPINLQSARVDANRRTITWKNVSTKNTSYKISRNGHPVDTGTLNNGNAFNDTGLSPDKAYVYTVSACAGSNCSSISKILPEGGVADINANQVALPLPNVQPLASQISNDFKISRGNKFFASVYSTIIEAPAKAIMDVSREGFTFFADKLNSALEQTEEFFTAHGQSIKESFFTTITASPINGALYKDINVTPGMVYIYRVRYAGTQQAWSNLTATKALSVGNFSDDSWPICTGNSFCDSSIKKGGSVPGEMSEKQCTTNSDCRNVGRYGQSYMER